MAGGLHHPRLSASQAPTAAGPGHCALRDRARPAAADGLGGEADGDRRKAGRGALRGEHAELLASLHFWGTDCEDAEHTYEALVRAFEWFGGVPGEVLVDNQKAAVIAHRRGGAVQFHPRFLDLAGHYGFRPRACRPARAQTKGKDERHVGYVKHHFFVRYRAFESWAHLNQLADMVTLRD